MTNILSWVRLAPNGDIVYTIQSLDGIFRSRPVIAANPVGERVVSTLIPHAGSSFPDTDGTNVVYTLNGKILLWTPTGEHIVSTNTGSYLINNGWVAFTRPGSSGQSQIWTRSPSGEIAQRTFYGSSSSLESLGSTGALTFTNSAVNPPGRYLSRPGHQPFNISSLHGEPRWSDAGELTIILGRSLFGLNAGELRVVSRTGNTSVVALSGPPGQVVEVQSSANLVSWAAVGVVTNTSGSSWLTNQTAPQMQFYRARFLP